MFAAAVSSVAAQDYPQIDALGGAGHSYAVGDVDTVNRFNGNLTVRIPLASYAVGAHLSYDFTLVYNSSGVHKGISQLSEAFRPKPHPDGNAGAGWRWSLGDLREEVRPQGPNIFWFIDSDGAAHQFYDSLHPWADDSSPSTWYTRSGSYLRMKEPIPGGGLRNVEHPDGRIFVFNRYQTSPPKWRLVRIDDRFGHSVTISRTGNVTNVTDTLGRSHEVHWSPGDGNLLPDFVNRFDLAGPNGRRANWVLSHVWRDTYSCTTGEGSPMPYSMPLLYNVSQPNGLENPWQMGTQSSPAYTGGCAALAELRLPTRGLLRWTWQSWGFPKFAIFPEEPVRYTNGVRERRLLTPAGDLVGAWKYFQSQDGANSRTRTVLQPPSGACEVHHFRAPVQTSGWDYGLPFDPNVANTTAGLTLYLSQEIFPSSTSNDCSGTKLRTVYVHYERELGGADSNQRLYARRVHYEDDPATGVQYVQTRFSDFDGIGHFRQVETKGNVHVAGETRVERAQYNRNGNQTLIVDADGNPNPGYSHPGPNMTWILGVYAYQEQQEGSVTARQNFTFDSATGFLDSKHILRSGVTTGGQDVVIDYTRHPDSNVAGRGQVKDEKWSLGGGTPHLWLLHSYERGVLSKTEYLTSGGGTTNLFQYRATIDQNSGLPTQTIDTSGVVTNYTYDLLGRMTKAQPGAGGGACLTYTYTKAAGSTGPKWGVTRHNASCAGNLGQRESLYDPWGRKTHDRILTANGSAWSERRYRYNARGWLTGEAAWGSDWTDYLDFDAFGRPQTVTPPEGTEHDVKFQYAGDRWVRRGVSLDLNGPSPSEDRVAVSYEHRDSFGRLVQVETPAEPGGNLVATDYRYDVGNRLKRVDLGGQIRTFNYDNRGFLTQECHPEKGVSGNGCVNYPSYDALGNALQKQEGGQTLTSQYDFAGRLTKVSSNWDATVSEWFYDEGNGFGKGKVHLTRRTQGVDIPGDGLGPLAVAVEEKFHYEGPGGAPSVKALLVDLPGNRPTYAFLMGFVHNDAGQRTLTAYPTCNGAACEGDGPGRGVNTGWTRGFLTSVGGYASSIAYHPQGLWSTITHTNGVTDNQNVWQGQGRPGRIWTTGATGGTFDTGAFDYDGVGNVKRMGNADFGYDEVSRLKYAEVVCTGTAAADCHRQWYDYDTNGYGNLFKVTTQPRGGAQSTVQWAVNAGTNRLSSYAYDVAGNMTQSPQGRLWYDSQDALVRMGADTGDNAWRLFVYTADGERVWTIVGDLQILDVRGLDNEVLRRYTRSMPAGAWSTPWEWSDDTVWRGSQRLARVSATTTTHFHLDHLGTPRLQTNQGGQVGRKLDIYPFGRETPETHSPSVQYTGHERDNLGTVDGVDDMDYMHARFCSPQMGRFFQLDPIGGDPKRPQSWNRYAYAVNNPLKYTDPTGELLAVGYEVFKALQEELRRSGAGDFADSLTYKEVNGLLLLDSISDAQRVNGNELVDLVAEIANDEKRTVTLTFTSEDLSQFGGAITERSFLTYTIPIRMNLQQVSGTRVLGTFREGPRAGETGITGISRGAAIFHELGHAAAYLRGLSGDPDLAVHYENTFRHLSGDPFFRKSHSPKEAFWVPVRGGSR